MQKVPKSFDHIHEILSVWRVVRIFWSFFASCWATQNLESVFL